MKAKQSRDALREANVALTERCEKLEVDSKDRKYKKKWRKLKELYHELMSRWRLILDSLRDLLECPILLVQMENPSITYSGHTVDGGVMDEYISESLMILISFREQ